MTASAFSLSRRAMLCGAVASLSGVAKSASAAPQTGAAMALELAAGTLGLRPGQMASPVWTLSGGSDVVRLAQGSEIDIALANRLPVSASMSLRGFDGAPSIEPLLSRRPLAAGASETFGLKLRHAGTYFCDARLSGDGLEMPMPIRPLVVQETRPVAVDRDEVVLIEDWRFNSEGKLLAPGAAAVSETFYTANGRAAVEIDVKPHERLRLRFINGCHRAVVALKISSIDVRVMAIDGQPSEPFSARDGVLVMAPGSRIDAFVDAPAAGPPTTISLNDGVTSTTVARIVPSGGPPARAAPLPPAAALPSNGLPSELNLKAALRVDVGLEASADWLAPSAMSAATRTAFMVKRNRTVVLALMNRGSAPAVFHLHGHHFRLLDRLDDGWKPFWLDTLVVGAQQTQRIAFAAEHPGSYLMESMRTDWAAPRLLRSYRVE